MEYLLDKYRIEFMTATLGDYLDEDNKDFGLEYFKWEWKEFKEGITLQINYYEKIIGNITPEGLMTLIVTDWCLGCCKDENIDNEKLIELCRKIINEKYN